MKSLIRIIRQDFSANPQNTKGVFICFMFRWAHSWRGTREKPRKSSLPLLVLYRLIVEWILGVEIPAKTVIGPGLQIFHGQGVVVNGDAIIGKNAILRNGVTIGHKTPGGGSPKIGDNVSFGANSVLIGEVTLGNNIIIGALSLVNKSFGSNLIIAGNPAIEIGKLNPV